MLKLLTDADRVLAPPPGSPAAPQASRTPAAKIDIDKLKDELKKDIKKTHENGITFAKEEKLKEAIEQWEESIKLNPSNYKAHYNLGIAYLHTGHPGKATAKLRQAVKINPQYQAARIALEKVSQK